MLSPGQRLGRYEVIAPVGAGGMGEVYRSRDTELQREVALKVLPAELSSDHDRLKRFEREAKATAALAHPNVLTIFDVGQENGRSYIVVELLQGATLVTLMSSAGLPTREALDYAAQASRGLAAAHARGIVHRDVKPANLFVTSSGVVKILDFGLARIGNALGQPPEETTAEVTGPGMALGTLSYMSPEQLKGNILDGRSDLFSLGVVLYEMLSGRHPFRRDSYAETVSAILCDEPLDLSALDGRTPGTVARLVARCLEKRPEDRFQTASDLAHALQLVKPSHSQAAAPASAVPTDKPSSSPAVARTPSIAAFEAYLQAKQHVARWTLEEAKKAQALLQLAIRQDPSFAPAYAELARNLGAVAFYGYLPPRDLYEQELAAARKAIEIDLRSPDGHTVLATALFYHGWDWAASEASFRRALELSPEHVEAHHFYAWLLTALGRFEEALAHAATACRLDPLNLGARIASSTVQLFHGDYSAAVAEVKTALSFDPHGPIVRLYLGWALGMQGRHDEAVPVLQQASSSVPHDSFAAAYLAHGLGIAGRRAEAEACLKALLEASASRYVPSFNLALAFVGVGDRERAVSALEAAYEERGNWLVFLKVDRRWDGLRNHARFGQLVERMAFPA
jgi:serine/threonine protein kinase/Tfp pilus assembly protein PilF